MNSDKTGGLLILVPTINERDNIEAALHRISASVPAANILVVDDESSDGTWQLAEKTAQQLPQVEVMVRRGKIPGLGRSIRDGYRYALDKGYHEVCIVDCDLQHDPNDINRMRDEKPDPEIVVGSRYLSRDSFPEGYDKTSKWLSMVSNAVIRFSFGVTQRDLTSDFFLMRTAVLGQVPPESLISNGFALFFEVKIRALKAGYTVAEISAPTYVRQQGASTRSLRQIWLYAREFLSVLFELRFAK